MDGPEQQQRLLSGAIAKPRKIIVKRSRHIRDLSQDYSLNGGGGGTGVISGINGVGAGMVAGG